MELQIAPRDIPDAIVRAGATVRADQAGRAGNKLRSLLGPR
jgi:hypothetical protein